VLEGYNVEVTLLAISGLNKEFREQWVSASTCDPETLIEFSGRLCWDSTSKMGNDPERIQEWIRMGHESIIEHASATFYIRASRVFTHELVRHRIASYSQRSQRYVDESNPRYIVPSEINNAGQEVLQSYDISMQNAWSSYEQLLQSGISREIARYVLPNACETQIVMTMNFRELRHFIELRTSERALPEMRAVANEIRKIMKDRAPLVFADS